MELPSVFVILSLTLLSVVQCQFQTSCTLSFKDCGSVGGKVDDVQFNGTCKSGVAILTRGTTAQLNISLDSKVASSHLTASVHGIIGGIPVPFKLPDPNACDGKGIICPTKEDKHYNYTPSINVLKVYPKIELVVKWEVMDDNSNDLICLLVPAMIV